MEKLRDRFWLWAHPAGAHNNMWEIKGQSRMTPTEGAYYLGIRKVFMVCFGNEPQPPFDREAMALDSLDEVIWSVVGDAGCTPNPETLGHLDEILRLADKHPNIKGAVFDDFFGFGERESIFTPEVLGRMREKLHSKNLEMFLAMYFHNLDGPVPPHIAEFDGISMCTWKGDDIDKLDEYIEKAQPYVKGKRFFMVCYLYNYGQKREFTASEIEFQLNRYVEIIRKGVAEGVVLVSNTIADLGYEAVEYAKAWLKEHGDEPI